MTYENFIDNTGTWGNHKFLLWEALELTEGSNLPVVEYGAGDGSTPYLREYCESAGREFISYESHKEWAAKCGSIWIENWDTPHIYNPSSVILVDEAPGEERHKTMAIMKDFADIIVVHDSEDAATGYLLDRVWPLFKYRININRTGGGAGASAVSNKIDFTHLIGKSVGPYTIEA